LVHPTSINNLCLRLSAFICVHLWLILSPASIWFVPELATELSIRMFGPQMNADENGELGYGFLESVYRTAMTIALREAGLRIESEVELHARFRDGQSGFFERTCWWKGRSWSN
jgi:hypothetical protein